MNASLQVVLVSDQTLANLIPALMERPDTVVLVCSDAMAKKGQHIHLQTLLNRKAIATRIETGAPDTGLGHIHEYALALADRLDQEYPGVGITLNATGGTKLMAMGFIEAFRPVATRILYTDTAHRRLESLPIAQETVPPPQAMTDVLNVPDYLAAQNFRFIAAVSDDPEWCERATKRKAVCKYLGRNAGKLGDFIGMVNGLANRALEKIPGTYAERLAQPTQLLHGRAWGPWAEALGQLTQAGLVDWQEEGTRITFADVEEAQFLRGGWLEEYAWHTVRDAGLFDTRMGVTGHWHKNTETRNEFDVLATHLNQILFIECKTLRFMEGQNTDTALVYKMDSLGQDVRGLFGETWLLTARNPTDELLGRARNARLRIIGPDDLPRLRDIVRKWKDGTN